MTRETISRLEQADRVASKKVNHKRDTWPVRAVGAISDIADQPQMRLLCVGTIVAGLIRRDDRLTRAGVTMLSAHSVATWAKSTVKAVIDRKRPDSGNDPAARLGDSDAHEDNSFPSGHGAGAVAVARAFARSYPSQTFPAHGAALTVSAVQVPRGTHYVGDVIVGALIGLIAEQASNSVINIGTRIVEDKAWLPTQKAAEHGETSTLSTAV